MNLKNQLDIFDEIVSYLAHRVRLSLNYKKVFQFFNRIKLDKVITQYVGSITKRLIFGRSAPSKVKAFSQKTLRISIVKLITINQLVFRFPAFFRLVKKDSRTCEKPCCSPNTHFSPISGSNDARCLHHQQERRKSFRSTLQLICT